MQRSLEFGRSLVVLLVLLVFVSMIPPRPLSSVVVMPTMSIVSLMIVVPMRGQQFIVQMEVISLRW